MALAAVARKREPHAAGTKLETRIQKLESREEEISTRNGVCVVHRLWGLSLDGEARGVSQ
jgi:hypothetical protein